jgi:hypothetical protein
MMHHDEEMLVHDPMVEALEAGEGNGSVPLSVLDRLKARRSEIAAEHVLDLEVPGTGGLLVLQLVPLPRQRLSALTSRATRSTSPEVDLNLNADTLIAATRDVLARNRREDELMPLDPQAATRIDEKLAGFLGLPEATRAREVLAAVFALAPSPELAIGVSVGRYIEWATGAETEIEEDFSGE